MRAPPTAATLAMTAKPSTAGFAELYEDWFAEVVRWLPAIGVPLADVEDLAQEVFLVVQRRISGFDGRNVGAWLYSIATRVTRNHRRLAWVRKLFLGRGELPPQLSDGRHTPLELLEAHQAVLQLLDGLSDRRRRAFVLFEIEGYTGEEIAALENVPLATVWTRLHHARKQVIERARRMREKEEA